MTNNVLRPLVVLFALLSVITGLIYPMVVTGVGKIVLPKHAAGSLIVRNGKLIGSSLISQSFHEPKYFWCRLSATAPIPVDLVTASASGLDPEISPAAALYQVNRVAAARHLNADQLRTQVLAAVEGPQWGLSGESRVNVLKLNLALDSRH
jgi:K+-transporting ATPase ATPase C chain